MRSILGRMNSRDAHSAEQLDEIRCLLCADLVEARWQPEMKLDPSLGSEQGICCVPSTNSGEVRLQILEVSIDGNVTDSSIEDLAERGSVECPDPQPVNHC